LTAFPNIILAGRNAFSVQVSGGLAGACASLASEAERKYAACGLPLGFSNEATA